MTNQRGGMVGRVVVALASVVTFGAVVGGLPPASPSGVVHAAPPTPVFVADVNTEGRGSYPAEIVEMDDVVYFVADEATVGRELWKLENGTTSLVDDIRPGSEGSSPGNLRVVGTASGPLLFFTADDGVTGYELYVYDGTDLTVHDLDPGSPSSSPSDFVAFAGGVYFQGRTVAEGAELWRYDVGTQSPGSGPVADLVDGWSTPVQLTTVDDIGSPAPDILYFGATDTVNGRELHFIEASDPTTIGAIDFNAGTASGTPGQLTRMDGYLYLTANDGSGGVNIHRVVRTGPGTFSTTEIDVTSASWLTRVGDGLYFNDGAVGDDELMRVPSGSSAAAEVVADINPSGSSSPELLTVLSSGLLVYTADDGSSGRELWVTDPVSDSTAQVADLRPGASGADIQTIVPVAGSAFLAVADDGTNGRELHAFADVSGTLPITPALVDLDPASAAQPSDVAVFDVAGDRLAYFGAFAPGTGVELYAATLDGTLPPPTSLAADLQSGTDGSWASLFRPLGDGVFMIADTTVSGEEPYVLEGGTATRLRDIVPGPSGGGISEAADIAGRVVFTADDGIVGSEPWTTDGTTAGTAVLADLDPSSSHPIQLTPAGQRVVFALESDRTIYGTDGSAAGTAQLTDGGSPIEPADHLAAFQGGVVFAAADGPSDEALWRTDGTQAGTEMLVGSLTEVNDVRAGVDTLYLRVLDAGIGQDRLWASDGTSAGTHQVPSPAGTDVRVQRIGAVSGDRVYFVGEDDVSGKAGMYTSDGVTMRLLRDFDVDFGWDPDEPSDSGPLGDGRLLFSGAESAGRELWITDGTVGGTARLADLDAGSAADPDSFEHLNGWVYFSAFTDAEGDELYRSDGVAVEMIPPTVPGPVSSVDLWDDAIEAVGDRLYYLAEHPDHGMEPWYLDVTPAKPSKPTGVSAAAGAAGSGKATVSWTASPDVPYAPTTGYTVTSSPGGKTCTTSGSTSCVVSGLIAGTSYRFTVVAANRIGSSAPSALSNAVTVAATPTTTPPTTTPPTTTPPTTTPELQPLVPARLLETRDVPGVSTVDGDHLGEGTVAAGAVYELPVVSRGGVPADAAAVMLNVTALKPLGGGFLTVFPCGEKVPNASNVNYVAGDVVPNAVLAKVGVGGKVCIFTFAETHLLVDVTGFVPKGGSPSTLVPARLLETRDVPGVSTVDGDHLGEGTVAAGAVYELPVVSRGGVPADAAAVMLNVTALKPLGGGFLTVFPCGEKVPNASNVNYVAGDVVPNAVLAKVGVGGKVCIFTFAETHLLVDVTAAL